MGAVDEGTRIVEARRELAQAIYEVFAGLQARWLPVEEGRSIMADLRAAHGDAAFEAAKVRALVALQRANGGV